MCRRYDFLYKETLPVEVREAKAALKKATGERDRRRAQARLGRLQQRLHSYEQQTLGAEVWRLLWGLPCRCCRVLAFAVLLLLCINTLLLKRSMR